MSVFLRKVVLFFCAKCISWTFRLCFHNFNAAGARDACRQIHGYRHSSRIAKLSVSFSALVIVYVHSTVLHLRREYVSVTHSICDEPCGSYMPSARKGRHGGTLVQAKRVVFPCHYKLSGRRHLLPLGAGIVRVCATRRTPSAELFSWRMYTNLEPKFGT